MAQLCYLRLCAYLSTEALSCCLWLRMDMDLNMKKALMRYLKKETKNYCG